MHELARQLIARLGLEPLPHEGGYFRQTWRSDMGSAIYFLLTRDSFSALHRLAQEEIWHFHAGATVEHVQLDPKTGAVRVSRVGPEVLAGETPQLVVPAGVWQGARLAADAAADYALLSCTLAPPWDERGFELGQRAPLRTAFPAAHTWIDALTR